jgi:uncharacterized protein
MTRLRHAIALVAVTCITLSSLNADTLKALQLSGGCCHDYESQKGIIAKGLAERLDIEVTDYLEMDANKFKAHLSEPGWSAGYDLIIYNFCHAHEADADFIASVAKLHHDGLPAIATHCTMHSYHWKVKGDKKPWTQMLGVTSPNHGPKSKIKVDVVAPEHPVMKGIPATWTTPKGELYNVQAIHENTVVLAEGTRTEKGNKEPLACVWVNTYGKGKVFCTTLGHHNETMQAKEWMDMMANGVKWVTSDSE